MDLGLVGYAVPVVGGLFGLGAIYTALNWRRVVPTNEVHTVQSRKDTTPYGKGHESNVYYKFPTWMPIIGVSVITMPTSIFDVDLDRYEAYDIDRLPFVVDVKGFFQVAEPSTAAQRVAHFAELKDQLENIVKGAIRTILANSPLESILGKRAEFGDKFTEEVTGQLEAWGVKAVKNIELMDIRDAGDSKVIANIMAKKKSEIEMQSRTKVAENNRKADTAEIEAEQQVAVKREQAERAEGEARVEKERIVGLAEEASQQEIKEAAKLTAEKDMAVLKVEEEKRADINRNVAVIQAEQSKQEEVLAAEADLVKQQKAAEGVKANGEAAAEAERLMQMAPVSAKIALAKEIGENEGFTDYLVNIEQVGANKEVGIAKADAIAEGDLKVIATGGNIDDGVNSVLDMFSTKGGNSVGGMLSALKAHPEAAGFVEKFLGGAGGAKVADAAKKFLSNTDKKA